MAVDQLNLADFEAVRRWAERAAADYGNEHAAMIDALFAPPEGYDDVWLERLHEVYLFVEGQPCTCTEPSVDLDGGCPRCRVLNREHDRYVGHGR